jgi:pimeloyl-ACP methyl ester carboxylesterase
LTASIALQSAQVSVVQLPRLDAAGPEEEVVMIHGLAANLGFWYAAATQGFTQFGRVTMYDMLGHGHSEMAATGYSPGQLAAHLGQLLDCLQLDRVHLVAHSFGGMVALAFALKQPDRVKSLILADVRVWQAEPPSWKTAPSAWVERMRATGLKLEDTGMDPSFKVLVEAARLQLSKPARDRKAFGELPEERVLFQGQRSAERWLELIEKTGAYQEMTAGTDFALSDLPRIQQPILAMFVEHSLRKRSARALRRLCPDCRIEVVANAGHFFPVTRPRIFAGAALEFLETASLPRALRRPARRRLRRERALAGAGLP